MYRARTGKTPLLEGVNLKKLRFSEPGKGKMWSSFNPSISQNPEGKLAVVFRSSNYLLGQYQNYANLTVGTAIKNRVFFADVNGKLDMENFREVEFLGDYRRGVEDCRLLWRNGSWHFLGVIWETKHTPVPRVGLFKYDEKKSVAKLIKKYEGPEPKRTEKNWGALAIGESSEFDFIYDTEHIYKDGKLAKLSRPKKKYSHIRGGTQLIDWEDGYLALVHVTSKTTERILNPGTFSYQDAHFRDYTHLFVKYDLKGNLVGISSEFIFDVGWIEFASGLVQVGDKLVISYGVDDASMSFFVVDVAVVRKMLRKV